ncbi:MAG: RNA polymerase sigma factor [Oscillochloris sp.]|nr:RNA polymerase sigma factor [Oscillochloris sp.]
METGRLKEIQTEHEITRLYSDYATPLLRYLRRLTGNPETAEDLLQETFIKALRHLAQLNSSEGERAWLFRIARNCAYDHFRRQRHRAGVALDSVPDDALASFPLEDLLEAAEPINAALARMPEAYRVPLMLHSHAGYPLEVIAQRFGLKLGTVKSRLSRARAQFREHYVA